jgi:hypothetical protein
MPAAAEPETVEVDLHGIIQFQHMSDAIQCVTHDISEDYTETVVTASDPRICMGDNLDLNIFLPVEESPIKCTGRIVWLQRVRNRSKAEEEYLARISITHITQVDRRRLGLAMGKRRALAGRSRDGSCTHIS